MNRVVCVSLALFAVLGAAETAEAAACQALAGRWLAQMEGGSPRRINVWQWDFRQGVTGRKIFGTEGASPLPNDGAPGAYGSSSLHYVQCQDGFGAQVHLGFSGPGSASGGQVVVTLAQDGKTATLLGLGALAGRTGWATRMQN